MQKSENGNGLTAWAEIRKAQFGGESRKTEVVVTINKFDDAAVGANSFGKIELTEFLDGVGTPIEAEKGRVGISDISKSWIRVYRDLTHTKPAMVHPEKGLAVEIRLSPRNKPTVIGRVVGKFSIVTGGERIVDSCLLYTSPSPRDQRGSRMPSSA